MTSSIEKMNPKMESIKKDLFNMAMHGEWDNVVEIYRTNPKAHEAKLTRSGDTALHIAVSDGLVDKVEELVGSIISLRESKEIKEVLNIKNELGNTPLHNAASMGNVAMCQCIAKVDKSLVGARNHGNETPFFLAALYGKKEAFLCLHELCGTENGYNYCRRKDGDTILHCAISGDYFGLAFRIIHLYEKLVNSFNQHGWTPLHILASKPSAFRSGSHFGGWYKMIYHCILVDELEHEPSDHQLNQNLEVVEVEKEPSDQNLEVVEVEKEPSDHQLNQNLEVVEVEIEPSDLSFKEIIIDKCEPKNSLKKNQKYPENYETCVNFFPLLWELVSFINIFRSFWNWVLVGINATNGARRQLFPANYVTCFAFAKVASKAMLIIFGLGSNEIRKIEEKKKKHTWAVQIMNELLDYSSLYEYDNTGTNPGTQAEVEQTKPYDVSDAGTVNFAKDVESTDTEGNNKTDQGTVADSGTVSSANCCLCIYLISDPVAKKKPDAKKETPILIAAKNGIIEMVEKILKKFPVSIYDMNEHKKNIVLLAVENRQPHVYQHLLQTNRMKESVFQRVDDEGNSALHLAAKLGEHMPWLIPGAALQMQWEIKWHAFVKDSMPFHFFPYNNKEGQTSKEIFTESHLKLVQDGSQWLTSTSQSCSVVAALIATVAFASSTTVPGGIKQDSGSPTLENQPAFNVFAISSLVALCFSVTALIMFLSILTSRYQEGDFGKGLPRKLLLGLTSLFVSIASMLISFCAGHFFVLKDELKYAAFPVYAVTCLPITFFAVAQFPLYFDLLWAAFEKVPQRSYKVVLH
ncbi:ankyrin repeat and protein kinase domain-containing protein 1 [Fagus crenata]